MGLGEEIGVHQTQKARQPIFVAVMGSDGQRQHVVDHLAELCGQLVALRLRHFSAASCRGFCIGRALVRFIDHHQVPALLPDALAHIVLLGVVAGGDDLCRALPGVGEPLLVHRGKDAVARLPKPAQDVVVGLECEGRGAEDGDAV
ncbi:MAG: hypothetical protein ONB06_10260, partial [candidate division KSB1 bacterium]|nr:hypothetical protein [candidate division KSB1 bacterium]